MRSARAHAPAPGTPPSLSAWHNRPMARREHPLPRLGAKAPVPIVAGVILAGVLAASAGVRASEPVPSAEVEALFTDKRAQRRTRAGLPLTIEFHPGGRLEGFLPLGAGRDSGRWWAGDGRLCYQWRKLSNALRACMDVVREDGRVVVGSLWHGGWDELDDWLNGGPWFQ